MVFLEFSIIDIYLFSRIYKNIWALPFWVVLFLCGIRRQPYPLGNANAFPRLTATSTAPLAPLLQHRDFYFQPKLH